MKIFEKRFELKSGLIVNIKRIWPDRHAFLKYKLVPIKNSAFWDVDLAFRYDEEFQFFLPQLYVALIYLSGPGDSRYDDYKGSYSFTFELNVNKNNFDSKYIYHVCHYRSYIDFSLYQIVSKEDPRNESILYDPDDALFSNKDICYFSTFFCSYSLGYLEGARYTPQPFLKYSDSNLLLFGYSGNEYFIEQYEECDEYRKEKHLLREKYVFDIETDKGSGLGI